MLGWVCGCSFVYSALFGTGSLLYGNTPQFFAWLAVFVLSGLVHVAHPSRVLAGGEMTAGGGATREYFVPGRVELVGKHVDYAGGRSLTIATELAIRSRATTIDEPVIRLRQARGEVAMDVALSPETKATALRSSAYVTAVARRFARDFPHARKGVAIELQSDLPTSAGLSSSTALVVTLALAFIDANDLASDERWRAAVPTDDRVRGVRRGDRDGRGVRRFPRATAAWECAAARRITWRSCARRRERPASSATSPRSSSVACRGPGITSSRSR